MTATGRNEDCDIFNVRNILPNILPNISHLDMLGCPLYICVLLSIDSALLAVATLPLYY